jgi:hypothetical protein
MIVLVDQGLAPPPAALRTTLSTEFVQKGKKCPPLFLTPGGICACEIFTHGKKVLMDQALYSSSIALLTILSTVYVKKCTGPEKSKDADAHFLCLRIIRFRINGLGYKSRYSPQFCPQNMCRTGPSSADENFCIRKNHNQIMGLTRNSWIANNVVHRKCEECAHLPVSSRQATLRV